MPRELAIGNGNVHINFDDTGLIRDVYFPRTGQENHAPHQPSRFGVWAGGHFSWLSDPPWHRSLDYEEDTLVTRIEAVHPRLALQLLIRDAVDYQDDLFVRQLEVRDLSGHDREVRFFFHLDLHLYGTAVGDTVYFDPAHRSLVHYKRSRYVWLSGQVEGEQPGLHSWAVGVKEFAGLEGTWRDAEDGRLEEHPVAQGSVDGTGSLRLALPARGKAVAWFWLALGRRLEEVAELHRRVTAEGPERILARTRAFWRMWVDRAAPRLEGAPAHLGRLCKRSLLLLRTHVDNGGAILATADGDARHAEGGPGAYMWPRDAAFAAMALDRMGYWGLTRHFFRFCARILSPAGYFLQKYNPDGSLAPTHHPWCDAASRPQLPIEEDTTGLILLALWRHFALSSDVELVRELYSRLVVPAANFLALYRDPRTGLPLPSYGPTSSVRGVFTFTAAAVWAGLRAATRFAGLLGETAEANRWARAAEQVRDGVARYLYDPQLGLFLRLLASGGTSGDPCHVGPLVDASLWALFGLGLFSADDPRVVATLRRVESSLWTTRAGDDGAPTMAGIQPAWPGPGHPRVVATLWLAQWYIHMARHPVELEPAERLLSWVADQARPSGVLPDQVQGPDGWFRLTSPSTWAHATLVETVDLWLRQRRQLADAAGHHLA